MATGRGFAWLGRIRAQAQIAQSQSRLKFASSNLARSRELRPSNAVSQDVLDSDIAKVEALTAEQLQRGSDQSGACLVGGR